MKREIFTPNFYSPLLLLLAILSGGRAWGQTQTVILTSGTSWTAPAGVYSVTVECWGGGGGGGGSNNAGRSSGGGGGGAYAKLNTLTVTPGASVSYSVGAGGTGPNGNTDGGTGGDTWFSSVSTVMAKGGTGGIYNGAGGTGGQASASVGNTKYNGGNGGARGGSGNCGGCAAGGGGGAAGSTGAGNAGANGAGSGNPTAAGGNYKSEYGGAGGFGTGSAGNGGAGQVYGGAGGGAKKAQLFGSNQSGGAGRQGVIRLTYCIAPANPNAGADVTICNGASTTLNGSTTPYTGTFQAVYQDFEKNLTGWTFANTAPANAAWSWLLNPVASFSGNINSGSPSVIVADSDYGGGAGTTTMTSPSFNTTGYTSLSLNFRQYYNDYSSTDAAYVEVSTNGTSWTTVATYTTDQGSLTSFSSVSLNLNGYVGNSTLYVRFRYVHNNDDAWAIDDIVVSGNTTLPITYAWTPATALSATNVANPTANPTANQTYTLSVNHNGCANPNSDGVVVTVRPTPTASISGTTTVCQGASAQNITFTNPMVLPITVTYTINGGSSQTVNVAASSTATVSQATGTAGTFTYDLVSAAYQTAPNCSNIISGSAVVTVRPTPTASISGTTTVCQGVSAQDITFTNPMALPIAVTYTINGGSNQTVNVAASSTATVSQATGTAGTFTYDLVSAAYQTAPNCSNAISGSAVVTILPTPTASISGTTTVCQGASTQDITFTNPMALPITVAYTINGGSSQTVNVAASSTATVSQATGTAGTFTYDLVSAAYQTAPNCSNIISGSAVVTVRPTPTASISGTTTVCQGVSAQDITFTNPMALPIAVTYTINGGSSQTVNVAASSTATVSQATGTAGTFTYDLVSAAYQTAPNCSNVISGSAVVTVRPTPTASISGTTTVCQGASTQDITFTNPMALPITVTYTINGGSSQTVNVAASSTATVSQATGTAGTFTYDLVSAAYQTAPNCSNVISGSAVVTVRSLPTLTSASQATGVCPSNTATINLVGLVAGSIFTIDYTINGVPQTPATVTSNGSGVGSFSTPTLTIANNGQTLQINNIAYSTAPSCGQGFAINSTLSVHSLDWVNLQFPEVLRWTAARLSPLTVK